VHCRALFQELLETDADASKPEPPAEKVPFGDNEEPSSPAS